MGHIDTSKIDKILIIMVGGIGNMIFFTPALKALRKAYPLSTISFLLGPYGAEKVIEDSNLVDKKIVVEPEKYKGVMGQIRLIRQLRREKFYLSITSTGTNPLKSGLLCYLAGIKYRLGENIKGKDFFYNLKVPFDKNSHEAESNISLVQKLDIKVEDKSLYIYRSSEDKNFARRFFANNDLEGKLVIGMHPGSGIHQAGFKRWPKKRFAQLADRLVDNYDAKIILFGGPEEISLADDINKLMSTKPLTMTGKTTLSLAAALIEKCSLFISNDSGLSHAACAVNTPTIAIYGPTNHKRTGLYSDSSILIRKDISCGPCYTGKPIHCSHMECFNLITVKDVIEKVEKQLNKYV